MWILMRNICLIGMKGEDYRATPLQRTNYFTFYEDDRATPLGCPYVWTFYEDGRATPLLILENIKSTKIAGLRPLLFTKYIQSHILKIILF